MIDSGRPVHLGLFEYGEGALVKAIRCCDRILSIREIITILTALTGGGLCGGRILWTRVSWNTPPVIQEVNWARRTGWLGSFGDVKTWTIDSVRVRARRVGVALKQFW